MPSNHLVLCHPLLLPSIFPSFFRVFCSELTLPIRGPKHWSFSFNISPSNEHLGLISFRMDWLDLWVGKIPWSKSWQPTPVLLPGKFHGQRSLEDYSPWGQKTLDPTAAVAKSLQLCPTLCNPIDSSPPGSPVLGFSRQEHWSGVPLPSPMHACMLRHFSHVRLCGTPWTAAHQAPLSTGFSRQEHLEWVAISFCSIVCYQLPKNRGYICL